MRTRFWEERLDISSFSAKEFHLAWAWLYGVYALRVDACKHTTIHYICTYLCRWAAKECLHFMYSGRLYVQALESQRQSLCTGACVSVVFRQLMKSYKIHKNRISVYVSSMDMLCTTPAQFYHIFSSTLPLSSHSISHFRVMYLFGHTIHYRIWTGQGLKSRKL